MFSVWVPLVGRPVPRESCRSEPSFRGRSEVRWLTGCAPGGGPSCSFLAPLGHHLSRNVLLLPVLEIMRIITVTIIMIRITITIRILLLIIMTIKIITTTNITTIMIITIMT
jgi:hypothetical protein